VRLPVSPPRHVWIQQFTGTVSECHPPNRLAARLSHDRDSEYFATPGISV
jgi:hypothetical protein